MLAFSLEGRTIPADHYAVRIIGDIYTGGKRVDAVELQFDGQYGNFAITYPVGFLIEFTFITILEYSGNQVIQWEWQGGTVSARDYDPFEDGILDLKRGLDWSKPNHRYLLQEWQNKWMPERTQTLIKEYENNWSYNPTTRRYSRRSTTSKSQTSPQAQNYSDGFFDFLASLNIEAALRFLLIIVILIICFSVINYILGILGFHQLVW